METSQLIELKKLLDEGVITEEEFAVQKQKFLDASVGKKTSAKPTIQPLQAIAIICAACSILVGSLFFFSSMMMSIRYLTISNLPYPASHLAAIIASIIIIFANVKPAQKGLCVASIALTTLAILCTLIYLTQLFILDTELGYSFDFIPYLATEGFPQIMVTVALILTLVKKKSRK